MSNVTKDDIKTAARQVLCKKSLAHFVEHTTRDTFGRPLKLHSWQKEHFCPLLHAKPSGRRIRFHAPPQYGKSIIMSKRFPLWLLINNPMLRIVVVTYNQDFAAAFFDALKSAVDSASDIFPWFKLTGNLSNGLVTSERKALNDGSSSIVFATIETGFTGKGCDIVIIDDPYRGLEDAMSPAYRRTVESFFDNKLFPRVNEKTDIYLMYHAWCQGDIGDYAVEKYSFTQYTFSAIATGDPNDPTGREPGELLSPMRTREHLEDIEKRDPKMFAAMFQGNPIADGERPLNTDHIMVKPVDTCPMLRSWTRGFDTAYTSKTGSDHSATLKVAFDEHGILHIRGFQKARVPLGEITDWALNVAQKDPPRTWQAVEMHNAGFAVVEYLERTPGISPWVVRQRVSGAEGKLRVRLVEFIHLLYTTGRVIVYQEGDYQKFLDECETFTGLVEGESDDLLAALAVCLLAIRGQKTEREPHEERHYAPKSELWRNFRAGS